MVYYLKLYKTGKSGIRLVWLVLLLILIHKLLPMVPHSWNLMIKGIIDISMLIKRRPFIYVILNFIIISILISSSSFTLTLTNFLIKIHKKTSRPFDDNDDEWWASITTLHGVHETVSLQPRGVEEIKEVNVVENTTSFENHAEGKVVDEEEVKETMDETWKAIMEAKRKGSGPQLKKCETWNCGDRGGGRRLKYDDDELRKRADAFIERVNKEMRLQRMESHQRFLEIINRGL